MRLAYADPPYPGQARRLYGDHPDYAGEVDYRQLVERLERDYDGWALSTSMTSLRFVLSLCSDDVVIASWHVTNAMPPGKLRWKHFYAWEPVIVNPGRSNTTVKNVIALPSPMGFLSTTNAEHTFTGKKPAGFSHWVFNLLGADHDDELDDLFPGSGSVTRAWNAWRNQRRLAV